MPAYRISWPHTFCIHIRSVNVFKFRTVEGKEFKSSECVDVIVYGMIYLLNLIKIGSEVIRGTRTQTQTGPQRSRQTDRKNGDLTSLSFLFKENGIKSKHWTHNM